MNPYTNLSLLLLTHNSSSNPKKLWTWLDKCLKINEIVAVDDNSTDDTVKILKSFESKDRKILIQSRGLANNFSDQRSFGLKYATNDWIFWLDSDELPSPELIKFLNHFEPQPNFAYSLPRLDHFLGRQLKHGETASLRFTRIFNKSHGKFLGTVHETWQTSDKIIFINHPIFHYSHPSFYSLMEKINFYSDIRAQELYRQKIHTNLFQIIFYPLGKFLYSYIVRLGFLDSVPGIVMALSMSFHSFLVRAKLWHLWQS